MESETPKKLPKIFSHYKEILNMDPLEKRKFLKEQFKQRKAINKNSGKNNYSCNHLKLELQPETIDWYRTFTGGGAKSE